MRSTFLSAAALSFALAACGSPDAEAPADEAAMEGEAAAAAPMQAMAMLITAEGEEAGMATATAEGDSVSIRFEGLNLPAGEHGVHVHTTGACEPPFDSAGPHWNPAMETHGLEGPEGQHAGDMPNLEVGEDGTGTITYTLAGGATFEGLMDADGSAFMVHASADDQTTDPSGDSGARIACGVFEAGGAADMGVAPEAGDTM